MRLCRFNPLDQPFHRRDVVRVGTLSALASCLPDLLGSQTLGASAVDPPSNGRLFGRARQVILLFLSGGPPQHETFDPKPLAPSEIRGPFKPIDTNVPGIQFCELLPRTAARADRLAVIRSMFTNNNIHGGSGYWVLTGRPMLTGDGENAAPTDWPNLASIVKRFRPSDQVPALSAVSLPELFIGNGGNIEAGQFGGILGPQYSPEFIECRPAEPDSPLAGLYQSKIPSDQMGRRVTLLDALGHTFDATPRSAVVQLYEGLQRQAFDLLTTGQARKAFRLEDETDRVRDRYGRHPWGQSVLLARRLIEAGVRFVTVNWPRVSGDRGVDNPLWDTHARNFDRMEDCLAPQFDVGFTALIDDLSDRGLLDDTLIVAVGEFGRTPAVNANAGRDHWGSVFSCVFCGAGISGGQVYGASDREGGYPANDPVDAGHLAATVFHLVGINTQGTFQDRLGRELSITDAEPLFKLLGEEPATTPRATTTGDVAFVPPYRPGLLLHPDFNEVTQLLALDAPASPKGWRATPIIGESRGFGIRLNDWRRRESVMRTSVEEKSPHTNPLSASPERGGRPIANGLAEDESDSSRTASMGIWTNRADDVVVPADSIAVLAQQIRDPQSGHFTVKARVSGGGSSATSFQQLFAANFRCRLVIFQFTHPSKSVMHRRELASVEFTPAWSESLAENSTQTIILEKRLAPTPGVNFTFGLGVGIALIVERKTDGPLKFSANSGNGFLNVRRVDVDFEGWKLG